MVLEQETKFLRDEKGHATQVMLDYSDYKKIAEQLDLPIEPAYKNPALDWISNLEYAHDLLNGLIADCIREAFLEKEKTNPDQTRIAEFEATRLDARKTLNNPEHFSTLDKLLAVIEKYEPIYKAEKKKQAQAH